MNTIGNGFLRNDRWKPEPLETVYESLGTSVSKIYLRTIWEDPKVIAATPRSGDQYVSTAGR